MINRELRVIASWLLSATILIVVQTFDMNIITPTNECHSTSFTFECATGTGWMVVNNPSTAMIGLNVLFALSILSFLVSVIFWLEKKGAIELDC